MKLAQRAALVLHALSVRIEALANNLDPTSVKFRQFVEDANRTLNAFAKAAVKTTQMIAQIIVLVELLVVIFGAASATAEQ